MMFRPIAATLAAPTLLLVLLLVAVAPAAGHGGNRAPDRADTAVSAAALGWPPRWPRLTPSPTPHLPEQVLLDEETLQDLVIFSFFPGEEPASIPVGSLDTTVQIQPGGSLTLTIGVFDCCYFFEPVPARVVWSIAPSDGAGVDPTTGLLTIDPTTPNGTVFTVRADVESGRRVIAVEVHVFTPAANPLAGFWREEAQVSCDTGAEVLPEQPIKELVFGADGTFGVTWIPFEVYQDYWGTYTFDLAQGTLELVITGGNYVPSDMDGQGRFAFDAAGRLILTELWLGIPQNGVYPANCGHRFSG